MGIEVSKDQDVSIRGCGYAAKGGVKSQVSDVSGSRRAIHAPGDSTRQMMFQEDRLRISALEDAPENDQKAGWGGNQDTPFLLRLLLRNSACNAGSSNSLSRTPGSKQVSVSRAIEFVRSDEAVVRRSITSFVMLRHLIYHRVRDLLIPRELELELGLRGTKH